MKYTLGFENHCYIGEAGAEPTTELLNIKDVTVSLSAEVKDATARYAGAFKINVPGMIDAGVEYTVIADSDTESAAGVTMLRDAFINRKALAVKLTLGDGAYFMSDMIVEKMDNNQQNDDVVTYSVSMKPTITKADFKPTIATGAPAV